MYKSPLGPTAPCSTVQHTHIGSTNSLIDNLQKATQVMAGGGQQQTMQIASSTFSQLSSPLPQLYKLYPSQLPPFHYHPTHSIRLTYQPSIFPSLIFLTPNTCISTQNGLHLSPPHFHIPYTPYLLSSLHITMTIQTLNYVINN